MINCYYYFLNIYIWFFLNILSPVYLLVISDQNEVLAGFAEGGDGVRLQHLCRLFHDHQSRLQLLQSLSVFSRSCGGHTHDPSLLQHTQILTTTDFIEPLRCVLIHLLRGEGLSAKITPVAQNPKTEGENKDVTSMNLI